MPIEDIEAYVNRSTEERLREVREGKHPGKIKRPMNAFMLYRKAYQARTKDWCLHNNHQVVSQVCGDSWPLEPPELRERFIEWARIERENHQRAHPGYKFTPSKPKNRASSEDLQDDMSEPSDLDDPEWRAGGGSCKHGGAAVRRSKRTGNGRGTYQNMYDLYPSDAPTAAASRVPTPSPAEYHQQYGPQQRHDMDGGTGMRVDSTFVASNPGKPLPPPYEPHALGGGEYYRQSVRPGSSGGSLGVQDVILQKTQVPGGRGYDLDILGRVVAGGSPEGGAGAIELGVVDSHQLATLYQQPNYHGSHGQQEQSIYPSPMDANASIVDPELHVQQAQLMRQQQTPRMLTRAQIQRAHVQAQQNARVALQLQEQQQLHGLSSADQHALIQHLQRHPEQHQLQLVPQHLQRQVDQHLAALTPVDPNVPSAVYDEYDGGTVGGDLSGLDGYTFHDEGTHQSQEDVSHHQSNEWWAPLELVSPSQLFGQSSGLDGHQSHHINDPNGANIPVDDALLALGTGIPASATSVARTETEGSGAAIAVASHLPDLSCAHRMSLAGTDDSWHVIGDPLRGDIASSGGCMAVNEQGEILPLSPPGVPDVGTAANGGEHGDQDPAAGTQFDNLLTPPEENQRDQGKGQEQAEEQLRGLPAADEHGIDAAMKADVSEQQ